MKIIVQPDAKSAAEKSADLLANEIWYNPKVIFGLATGGTMEAVYARLANLYRLGNVSFSSAQSFNVDEYVGLAADNIHSYAWYMKYHFFSHVDFSKKAIWLLRGDASDPKREATRYESEIRSCGGIDIQILGLGVNGHIGFNEPGDRLHSTTRVIRLTHSTRIINSRYFPSVRNVPHYAITMGLNTILRARRLILLATGPSKIGAVVEMIEGPICKSCPASVLQLHGDVTVILDKDAASGLSK